MFYRAHSLTKLLAGECVLGWGVLGGGGAFHNLKEDCRAFKMITHRISNSRTAYVKNFAQWLRLGEHSLFGT